MPAHKRKPNYNPTFSRPLNRIVTVMYKTRLTGKFFVPIIASDCNGKGDKPWAESKSTQNTKRELKLS